jgi:hypothetical protein
MSKKFPRIYMELEYEPGTFDPHLVSTAVLAHAADLIVSIDEDGNRTVLKNRTGKKLPK